MQFLRPCLFLLCVPLFSTESWTCESHKFIFVVATGRSGSTTILSLLNGLPEVYVAGENYGIWQVIWRSYLELNRRRNLLTLQYSAAWQHTETQNKSIMFDGFRLVLFGSIHPPASAVFVGFKEIRWAWRYSLLDVDFLFDVFPCARVILNYRDNITAQHQSAFHRSTSLRQLVKKNRALFNAHLRHRETSFLISTEELLYVSKVDRLFQWLNFSHCRAIHIPNHNSNGSLIGLSESLLKATAPVINCLPGVG